MIELHFQVKATVPFLLLFPILAFCIRALVYSVLSRMDEETGNWKSDKENLTAEHEPKLTRWHGILDGNSETEASSPGYNLTVSNQNRHCFSLLLCYICNN